jgi:hypothetical protein
MFKAKVIDSFISEENCSYLIKKALELDSWGEGGHGFWSNRIADYSKVLEYDKIAASIMLDANNRCRKEIKKYYSLEIPLYSDTLQIIRWFPGMDQPPHADNMSNLVYSGHEHNKHKHRVFGSIIYLNNDYTGGKTYYPNFNVSITPKSGSLAFHPADPEHLHGVTKVENSMRYTIASFWTFDPLMAGFWNTKDSNK